ncbi:MAG TPA: methyltransferase domain-containing protein [Polyangiaceae bacterium]|nr:methyltransferase domain-containing protein [Polyangiaceae bacterium]
MSLGNLLYGQFRRPSGVLGSAVGHLMAIKNRQRGRWVLAQLGLEPGARVLEVGSGPGADAARVLARLGPSGSFVGVDASDVMVRQSSARNRAAVRDGRAIFVRADLTAGLPSSSGEFDLVYTINCVQFWPELAGGLRELSRVTRSGGRIVIAVQPMRRGATESDSEQWADKLRSAALAAKLPMIELARGATRPSTVALVLERPRACPAEPGQRSTSGLIDGGAARPGES